MQKRKTLKSILLRYSAVALFAVLMVSFILSIAQTKHANAVSNNGVINFQARLLTSSGAIVPDGSYNIQFRLYDKSLLSSDTGSIVASTGGTTGNCGTDVDCEWQETYTGGTAVSVADGYISVNLGSVTSFPSTIHWEQPQYLTMNIGGIGSVNWDGEMGSGGPTGARIQLTALPYAYNATQLTNNSGSNRQVLSWGSDTGADAITLPDASGSLLLGSGTGNVGVELSPSGAQTGSLNITGTGTVSGILTSSGSNDLDTSAGSGTLNIGQSNATTINLGLIAGSAAIKVVTGNSFAAYGSSTFQDNTTSTTAFNVTNVAGGSLLSVDNSGEQTILGNNGATSAQAGKLVFANGNNSSPATITLSASSSSSTYSLILPTSAPSANLCLESGPTGSTSQLGFVSCANSSPTITATGGSWSGTATSGTTITGGTLSTVAPTTAGDLEVVTISLPSSGGTVSGVSGGGVTSWVKPVVVSPVAGSANRVEMWYGTVTSTGTHPLTVTHTGSISAGTAEVDDTEFTALGVNAGTTWGIGASGAASSSTATSALNFYNSSGVGLNPPSSGELYYGFASDQDFGLGGSSTCPNVPSSGTTWTCATSADGHNLTDYNLNTQAGTTTGYYGTATLSTNEAYSSVSALFVAFVNSTAINNSVSTQEANFNVQAATSGSVAGVLQANVSGSADILDLENGTGTIVDSFGSTGNETINTNSSTALNVNSSGGSQLFNIDASNTTGANSYATPGTWSSSITYSIGNLVVNTGTYYVYINSSATYGNLVTNITYWQQVTNTAGYSVGSAAAYSSGTIYHQGYLALSSGIYYIFINSTPSSGNAPPNITYWVPVSTGYNISLDNSTQPGTIQIGNSSGAVTQNIFIGNNSTSGSDSNVTIGSTIAGSTVLQGGAVSETIAGTSSTGGVTIAGGSSGSTSLLQVQNAAGNASLLTVDSVNNQTVFGNISANAAKIVLDDGSNGQQITISTGTTTSGYTLNLPTSTPASGLCLETNSVVGTVAQLAFNSCASATPVITFVHENDTHTSISGSSETLPFTSGYPLTVGDLEVMMTQIVTPGVTVTSVNTSGNNGGVTQWNRAVVQTGSAVGSGGTISRVEMWYGTVQSTSVSSLTVNYSAAPGTGTEVAESEFTATGVSSSSSWGYTSVGSHLNSTASTNLTYPSLSPSTANQLYLGYGQDGINSTLPYTGYSNCNALSVYNCIATSENDVIDYETPTTMGTPAAPVPTLTSPTTSNTVASLFILYDNSTAINNDTSAQQGNLYVQAATSGSVAGTLQANASGTADIMDIKNGSGTITDSFNSNGSLSLEQGILGGFTDNNLSTPSISSVAYTGTGSSYSYTYYVVAVSANGTTTPASTGVPGSSESISLSSSNWNLITWSAVSGAYNYYVYVTTSSTGNKTCLINTTPANSASTTYTYSDYTSSNNMLCSSGSSGAGVNLIPTVDNSGAVTLNGTLNLPGGSTSTAPVIVLGNATNYISFTPTSSTAGITCGGNGCQSKVMILTPEYAGAVLDTGGQSTDIGTMISGASIVGITRQNYYQWTTTQTAAQSYDIVVQIPIPSDFKAWSVSTPISVFVNTSGNNTISAEVWDTTGTIETNWGAGSGSTLGCSLVTLSTGTSWIPEGSGCTIGGTYTPNGIMTMRLRLSASSTTGYAWLGEISLGYISTM